jgi:thiamine-phosphate pyrophosphorylase
LFLYYITDRKQFSGGESERQQRLLEKVSEAAQNGIDYIQLREKDLSTRALERLARETMQRVVGTSAKLLINSRADVALSARAHGLHLRSNDISTEDVRKIWRAAGVGTSPIVAVSCHAEYEIIAAKQAGAGFVVFGPVFEKSQQPGVGLEALRAVCRHDVPVLALGGVTLGNAFSCIDAGAAGVAGIRLFQENEIGEIVRALRGKTTG